VFVILEGFIGRYNIGMRPRVLGRQGVLNDFRTLILEYLCSRNVVPMIVAIDHEFHRLVGHLLDLIHHVLGGRGIDRIGDDHAIACHHDHGAVNPRAEAVDVISNLC
jgi:hypothetical protein